MSAPVVVVQQPPPGAPVAAYAMHRYVLPMQYRQVSLAASIAILCIGLASILIGGLSFASYGYWYYISVLTGVDFWVGASFCLAGVFGIVIHTNQRNPSLMHSYYAFYIIAMIFAGIQFSIAVPSLARRPYGGAVWQPIVTLTISIVAFSTALIPTIIASKFIYCKPDITSQGIVQYHAGVQQPIAAQPVVFMQSPQPVYIQQAPNQYAAMPQQTVINASQGVPLAQATPQMQPVQYQQTQQFYKQLPQQQPQQVVQQLPPQQLQQQQYQQVIQNPQQQLQQPQQQYQQAPQQQPQQQYQQAPQQQPQQQYQQAPQQQPQQQYQQAPQQQQQPSQLQQQSLQQSSQPQQQVQQGAQSNSQSSNSDTNPKQPEVQSTTDSQDQSTFYDEEESLINIS